MALDRLAYHANCWGPLGGEGVGVTSISELYYRTFADMGRAFADIALVGYDGVELFDGNLFDHTAAEMRALLDDHGIRLVAAYSGANFIFDDILPQELARIARVAERAAKIGALHLVVGGGAKRFDGVRDDDYPKLGAALEQVKDIARASGLCAHYHPHLTTIVESSAEIDKILDLTSIDFCPDIAHLAAAGGDPAAIIRRHLSRISYVHLKGYQRQPFAFTPLDRGDVSMDAIVSVLREGNFDGWICAELDSWPDPLEGAKISKTYLDACLS